MREPTAEAEYDTLRAVRVHEPGIEAAIGAMDPGPNHFARPFSVCEAKREHRRMVEVLEDAGVEVLPDGEGLDPDQLTNGGGGIHCMTSPIRRA
ncbi:hypothetical protein [Halorubrum cibi]|uniref:Arginine deiminase n=1 Tax=Halorubrum cibi TaxID=413815 RepID=A0A521ACA1_9EURY|nr:hypothetical protein [Halorubrum cibi]SMO32457.1 hypothetical protein SAMN06264867_10158 [Halorubrum cibi]